MGAERRVESREPGDQEAVSQLGTERDCSQTVRPPGGYWAILALPGNKSRRSLVSRHNGKYQDRKKVLDAIRHLPHLPWPTAPGTWHVLRAAGPCAGGSAKAGAFQPARSGHEQGPLTAHTVIS